MEGKNFLNEVDKAYSKGMNPYGKAIEGIQAIINTNERGINKNETDKPGINKTEVNEEEITL